MSLFLYTINGVHDEIVSLPNGNPKNQNKKGRSCDNVISIQINKTQQFLLDDGILSFNIYICIYQQTLLYR